MRAVGDTGHQLVVVQQQEALEDAERGVAGDRRAHVAADRRHVDGVGRVLVLHVPVRGRARRREVAVLLNELYGGVEGRRRERGAQRLGERGFAAAGGAGDDEERRHGGRSPTTRLGCECAPIARSERCA